MNVLISLPTGAEAESQGSAPSPGSQQGARNDQGPRGNKARRRPGSHSHPPSSSSAPTTDEHGSPAVKKIGQTPPQLLSSQREAEKALIDQTRRDVTDVFFFSSSSASNIDRSVKDLQRCTASLTRYRMVVKEEMDSSIKRMKQTFAELQSWYAHCFLFFFLSHTPASDLKLQLNPEVIKFLEHVEK